MVLLILPLSMRKHTTLDLDTDLVSEAAAALGTARITDTVHAALTEVVARRKRAWLARFDFADLSPESLADIRRPRSTDTGFSAEESRAGTSTSGVG